MYRMGTAARLKAWRKRQALEQKHCGEACNIGQGAWSEIERGLRHPNLFQAARIALLTKGEVGITDWLTPRLRTKLRELVPAPTESAHSLCEDANVEEAG